MVCCARAVSAQRGFQEISAFLAEVERDLQKRAEKKVAARQKLLDTGKSSPETSPTAVEAPALDVS